MKKNIIKFVSFIGLSSLFLSSCITSQNNPIIYQSDINEMTSLKTEDLEKILDSDLSSLLFVGSQGCGSCELVKKYMNSYITANNTNVYYYDIASNLDYMTIFQKYPNVFKEQTWPQIMVTKAKEQIKKLDLSRINNENQFFSELNSIIRKSKSIDIKTKNTIENILLENEYFIYIYDISNKETYQKYTNFLLDKVENSNILSGIISSYFFSEGKDLVKERLEITYDNFTLIKKNGNTIVAEYSDDIKMQEIAKLL